MQDRSDIEAEQISRDLATLAYDLASTQMRLVGRRYGVEIKLYNPNQPRVPAKQHGAGQWTKAPLSTTAAVRAGARALGALAASPEAAPIAGAALLPGMIGGIGISRAAGLNAVVGGGGASQGMGMTPILGLPFSVQMGPGPLSPGQIQQKNNVYRECDAQLDDDLEACSKLTPQGQSSGYTEKQSYAICARQAVKRYSECIAGGGPGAVRSPLFTFGKGHR